MTVPHTGTPLPNCTPVSSSMSSHLCQLVRFFVVDGRMFNPRIVASRVLYRRALKPLLFLISFNDALNSIAADLRSPLLTIQKLSAPSDLTNLLALLAGFSLAYLPWTDGMMIGLRILLREVQSLSPVVFFTKMAHKQPPPIFAT